MNYFEFYKLPISFSIDEHKLRQQYLALSKKYHPDFYTLDREEKQAEILGLSTLNNEAYKTLSNQDKRIKYVLELKGILKEEGNNEIPAAFLSDIMGINEALMELEFGFDETVYQEIKVTVRNLEKKLYQEVKGLLESDDVEKLSPKNLEEVKEFYLKKRYLLRILENLDRFAPAQKEGF